MLELIAPAVLGAPEVPPISSIVERRCWWSTPSSSFLQEQRASRRRRDPARTGFRCTARVRRDGAWQSSRPGAGPRRYRAPPRGRLRPGRRCRVVTGELAVDQSALTGESPGRRPRDRTASLYSGSIVRRGEAERRRHRDRRRRTYFGRTTELVQSARPKLHIEDVVARVVRWLFVIVGVLLAVTLGRRRLRAALRCSRSLPLMLVLLHERGTGRAAGDVHRQHGRWAPWSSRGKGVLVTRLERRRGRRQHGCALRRQDRDDHASTGLSVAERRCREPGLTEGEYAALRRRSPRKRPTRTRSTSPSSPRRRDRPAAGARAPVTGRRFTPFDPRDPPDRGRRRRRRPAACG